jgi:hypothetical protein
LGILSAPPQLERAHPSSCTVQPTELIPSPQFKYAQQYHIKPKIRSFCCKFSFFFRWLLAPFEYLLNLINQINPTQTKKKLTPAWRVLPARCDLREKGNSFFSLVLFPRSPMAAAANKKHFKTANAILQRCIQALCPLDGSTSGSYLPPAALDALEKELTPRCTTRGPLDMAATLEIFKQAATNVCVGALESTGKAGNFNLQTLERVQMFFKLSNDRSFDGLEASISTLLKTLDVPNAVNVDAEQFLSAFFAVLHSAHVVSFFFLPLSSLLIVSLPFVRLVNMKEMEVIHLICYCDIHLFRVIPVSRQMHVVRDRRLWMFMMDILPQSLLRFILLPRLVDVHWIRPCQHRQVSVSHLAR